MLLRGCLIVTAIAFLVGCQTAAATPPPQTLAEYKKLLDDRLGQLWLYWASQHLYEVRLRPVKVTFTIPAAGGAVRILKVVTRPGNDVDAQVVVEALRDLHAPPVPPKLLDGKRALVVEENFPSATR